MVTILVMENGHKFKAILVDLCPDGKKRGEQGGERRGEKEVGKERRDGGGIEFCH